MQKSTAKKVLKRFYKNPKMCDAETQIIDDHLLGEITKLENKILAIKREREHE